MAGYYSVWRFSRTTLAILLATACSAQLALGQYTFVQDPDAAGAWDDVANWTDGGSNTTFPNGIGATALINQPIRNFPSPYSLDMPATDVTVGTLTIDNTNDDYNTQILMKNHSGRLVFEDPSGTAKWIETTNTPDAPQSIQNTIGMPILVKNTLEINTGNYPNLNTGTIFQNRFDGDINSKIVKKGVGGIQFNLSAAPGAGFGFLGQIEIQEGAIRMINGTATIAQASGMTVVSGGQLQLADNATTAVPDFNMATGAVLNLNGLGKSNALAGPEGALRFGVTVAGRTATFHNPVNLQSDARIYVALSTAIGKLDSPVSGVGDLIKAGPGQLTLTGSNTYTGDTQINAGILSTATATLADTADVSLSTGAKFNLAFSGPDTIRSLYFAGVAQAIGTWGATGSGATNINDTFFTGTGILNVTVIPVGPVPGDYNSNGFVDAADYVLWRKGGPLANEVDAPGIVNGQDYIEWQARFGNPSSGSGTGLSGTAVPEPATFVLLMLIAPLFAGRNLGADLIMSYLMTRYLVKRAISAALAMLLVSMGSANVAWGQYTFVQDPDAAGNWDDVANWTDGGSNTTFPNGIGATALINQPIRSATFPYTLDMPATDVTVGSLTIDNTNDLYATKITMANHGGRLVFEDPSGTAKWIETANTPNAPTNVQNTIGMPILVKNTLEITQNNYQNLNTGTIFQNRFDGDINSTIIKKGPGGIQLNLNSALGAGQGFLGQILLQEGAIRTINKTFFLSTVKGITVSGGGQLQLAENAGTAVPDYNLAAGAVLKLNGNGTNAIGAPPLAPVGALNFGVIVSGRTMTFHNPVELQSDSTISVEAYVPSGTTQYGVPGTQGVLDNIVSGPGSLTKHGDGKLTITNAASGWGGDTHILTAPTDSSSPNGAGLSVLSLSNPILADGKDVYLSATRTALNLNFTGTDTIRSFFIDNLTQLTGIWGATGSGAAHESSLITGTGRLNVVGVTVGVPGDFNNNGVVDAADYVLWRKGGPLQNEVDVPGTVNGQDYLDWRARFGNPNPGSGSSLGASAVPEPATFVLFIFFAPFIGRRTLGRTRA